MVFPLKIVVAAGLLVAAAKPVVVGEWRPTAVQVARVETQVRMPTGASGPLVSYERYYFGEVRSGRRVIVGELVHIASAPVSPPVVRIVRRQDMPALADFGCAVIHFEFDVGRRQLSTPVCGGETPPPPHPH